MQSLVLGLTLFRIFASPVIFIAAIFFSNYWLSFWFFNLAALTDYFDGSLARKYRVESKLGAILDPIGDKLLVLFSIITIILITQNSYIALMGGLILSREFWVSALREYSSAQHNSQATRVTFIAKTKTTFQFISLGMFFLGEAADLALISFIASFFLLIALFLGYKSLVDYTQRVFEN
ncbi:MAG: CDP-alcohol phosphatidyltransferase family protein [Gammaproteobacteria bacterium]